MTANCEILAHQGAGLYSVKVVYDDKNYTDRIGELTEQINDPKRVLLETELIDLVTAYATLLLENKTAQSDVIEILKVTPRGTQEYSEQSKILNDVTKEVLEVNKKWLEAKLNLEEYYTYLNALEVEKAELIRVGSSDFNLEEVWCLDLSDGQHKIRGGTRFLYTPGTIVNLYCLAYDPSVKFIAPGMNPSILALDVRYNVMANFRKSTASAATFWNVAMEPGFAKWEPYLLAGVLTKRLKGAEHPLDLPRDCGDPIEAKEPGNVYWQVRFDAVHTRESENIIYPKTGVFVVNYFAGNEAFSVGDHVVLKAGIQSDGSVSGEIIGFYSYPKDATYDPIVTGGCIPTELEVFRVLLGGGGYDKAVEGTPPKNSWDYVIDRYNDSVGGFSFVSLSTRTDGFHWVVTDPLGYFETSSGCQIVPRGYYGARTSKFWTGGAAYPHESYLNYDTYWEQSFEDFGIHKIVVNSSETHGRIIGNQATYTALQTQKTPYWFCIPTGAYAYRKIVTTQIKIYELTTPSATITKEEKRVHTTDIIVDCNGAETIDTDYGVVVTGSVTVGVANDYDLYGYGYTDSDGLLQSDSVILDHNPGPFISSRQTGSSSC